MDVLLSLAEEIRACVLVITHDPEVAARVGRALPLHAINRVRPC